MVSCYCLLDVACPAWCRLLCSCIEYVVHCCNAVNILYITVIFLLLQLLPVPKSSASSRSCPSLSPFSLTSSAILFLHHLFGLPPVLHLPPSSCYSKPLPRRSVPHLSIRISATFLPHNRLENFSLCPFVILLADNTPDTLFQFIRSV